jgi:predicted MFS family arabinose efflux permease
MNVMMMIGFGSLITVLTGRIYDQYGCRPTVIFNLFLMTVTTLNIYVFIVTKTYNYQTFLMVFSWGMIDSSIQTHIYALIGSEFPNSTVAYAIFNLFQSSAVLIFEII